MKKGLIAAGLLISLSGTAQDVSTYTPGAMGEGVVYYLPKTEIELHRFSLCLSMGNGLIENACVFENTWTLDTTKKKQIFLNKER